MSEHQAAKEKFDLFVPFSIDLPLRDQREIMERPFFSLAKNKRIKPIDYTSPDGSIWVKVLPNAAYGMATIWDADILIWAASMFTKMRNSRPNDIPRTLPFHPFDLLRVIHRGTGGTEYRLLREALARLQSTVVRTNIRAEGGRKERQFGWLEGWTDLVDKNTGQSRGMTLTLSDWFYEGVQMKGGVLALVPSYFDIKSGRERWLYRVARKHAGGHGADGFEMSIRTLFEKSGAGGTYRRFKFELRRIVVRGELPDFYLAWEEPQKDRAKRRGGEPILRMTRRAALAPDHPGYRLSRT